MLRDFQVLSRIGKGSFGNVHRVRRTSTGKEYALKRVGLGGTSARDALAEVRFLASLRHPHIVRFFEAFPHGKSELCLVLEYAGGGDLCEVIRRHARRRKPLREPRLRRYAQQLCSALHFLHGYGILHRDLKPANIFLDAHGAIKIGDFNISKFTGRGRLTHTYVGTPYYMSPEIWKRQAYGIKTDIWALGCLLYQLTALRLPFEAKDRHTLALRVCRGRHAPLPVAYSAQWRATVSSMLRVLPACRPTTGELLAGHIGYGDLPRIVPRAPLLKTIRMTPHARHLRARMPEPQYSPASSARPAVRLPSLCPRLPRLCLR